MRSEESAEERRCLCDAALSVAVRGTIGGKEASGPKRRALWKGVRGHIRETGDIDPSHGMVPPHPGQDFPPPCLETFSKTHPEVSVLDDSLSSDVANED